MHEESHHHLIFQNSYVNVFFVEIPPHESTLLHHHDLPYVSVAPGGPDAAPFDSVPTDKRFEVAYSNGNFSHAVKNSSDETKQNIAIELVRAQGTVRNGCVGVQKDQSPGACSQGVPGIGTAGTRSIDFQSDEIVVESWFFNRGTTSALLNDPRDKLIAGITGMSVTGSGGLDSANALRGGVLWIPAGSPVYFRASSEHDGHFVSITFRDSGTAKP